jgi:Holliday junction resolvase/DNA-binding HxlR family transcriptional regulator
MNDLHFDASRPVEGGLFVNRVAELRRLDVALSKLRAGRADYLSVLGLRKQGKSSLFQEWMRRHAGLRDVAFVAVPCWAWPDPEAFFEEYVRLTINSVLNATEAVREVGLLPAPCDPGRIVELAAFAARRNWTGLGAALRFMADFKTFRNRASAFRNAVRMPETVACSDQLRLQFILDEFQELSGFDGFQTVKKGFGSIYAMLREEWQQQRHCNYIVSGSAVSLLRQITEDASAPFFQHFTAMHLGPLPERDAVGLLVDFSERSGVAISVELARRMTALVGTNPYYLQVLGEELVLGAEGPQLDDGTWKRVCQRVLLQPSGRLYQYFELLHQKVSGRSSLLEKILVALAEGPARGSQIAAAAGVTQNRLSSKLPLLEAQDVIIKEDLRYRLGDPCYALWLKAARGPVSAVAAPLLLGEESEKEVARELARQGVGLVYQSRASRGAFDLLAIYQTHQIGLQVKRIKKYPVYIGEREIGRMRSDARSLGWHAAIAFDLAGAVSIHALDGGIKTKRGRRYSEDSALRHILDVLEPGPSS